MFCVVCVYILAERERKVFNVRCYSHKYLLNIDCAIDFCPLSGLINWNIKLKIKLRRYANFFYMKLTLVITSPGTEYG